MSRSAKPRKTKTAPHVKVRSRTKPGFDLTLVVNTHEEDAIVIPTLKSARMAVEKAKKAGLRVEFLVLCDNPDARTLDLVTRLASEYGYVVKKIKVNDLGFARNAGCEFAKGDILAFMDGDDLMSENWLLQGYKFARQLGPEVILHPEMNYFFGPRRNYIFLHCDMDNPDFDIRVLLLQNYWTALSIGHRKTYAKFKYEPNTMELGWGYEDWGWNILTISHGLRHKTVPNTAHYIRQKESGSLLDMTVARKCLPRLHPLRHAVMQDIGERRKGVSAPDTSG